MKIKRRQRARVTARLQTLSLDACWTAVLTSVRLERTAAEVLAMLTGTGLSLAAVPKVLGHFNF